MYLISPCGGGTGIRLADQLASLARLGSLHEPRVALGPRAMGTLDAIITMLLFVCFGVYVFMGLVFIGMGAYYAADEGAVGSTGIYLILVGLLMLVIGGIAIFANLKKIWLVLFVIELFNVALFLVRRLPPFPLANDATSSTQALTNPNLAHWQVLFILIVCVLMMATGTTDPVRRATEKGWREAIKGLTIPGSAGVDAVADTTYCEVYGGTACNRWYSDSLASDDLCTIGEASKLTVKDALDNCTALAVGENYQDCSNVYQTCVDCDEACMDAAIQDVKDQILPASYFVFFMCAYLAIVVVWNNIMIASAELEGIKKILGLVFNGLLVLIAFIMVIMAAVAISEGKDACKDPEGGCVPDTLYGLVFIGLGLIVLGAICVAGVQINNHLLLRVGTLVMVFLSLCCLLTGLIMGISSGAVMDDMAYYYDSNYPRLRAALERADNSYCQLRKADCTTLASNTAGAGVAPAICNEDFSECEPIEGAPLMTSAQAWRGMWAVASQYASDPAVTASQPWLEVCETSGMCIFCDELYADIASTELPQLDSAGVAVTGCVAGTDATSTDGTTCLTAANLDWKAAVTTPGLTQATLPATVAQTPALTAPTGVTWTATDEAWAASTKEHGSKQKLKCANTGRVAAARRRC